MTRKTEYESKECLIANYERIAAEMDAMYGSHVPSMMHRLPSKGDASADGRQNSDVSD